MKISDQGLNLLKLREGVCSAAYRDSAGHLTIGVGHLLTRSELSSGKIRIGDESVRWRDGLTEAQIDNLLRQDLHRFEIAVTDAVSDRVKASGLALVQHQFDAVVSFAFNVGVGAFRDSTLRTLLVSGDRDSWIPDQFRRWVYAGGKVSKGLQKRRESEIAQWLTPYETYQPQPATVEKRLTHLETGLGLLEQHVNQLSYRVLAVEKRVLRLETSQQSVIEIDEDGKVTSKGIAQ